MRRAWPIFAAAALAGCAEISGLSNLDIGDGGTPSDSSADVTSDAADTGTIDSGGIDAPISGPWCQSGGPGPTPYTFCSDFDENSVTAGFAPGGTASWMLVSGGPTLDTSSPYTPPGCALFSSASGLSYTPSISQTTVSSFELQSRVELVAAGTNDVTFATLNIDGSHAVTVGLTVLGNTGPAILIKEIETAADGGAPIVVNHTISATATAGTYSKTVLAVTATTITFDLDASNNVINRSQPSSLGKMSARIGSSADGWSVRFDDVVLRVQ